jgi:hypothetical protein
MKADKADKNNSMVELNGKVVKKKFAKGSKSEHDAVCLETDSGSFVLRRKGGNPFNDPELHKLIGEKICATGIINNYSFIASDLKKIN